MYNLVSRFLLGGRINPSCIRQCSGAVSLPKKQSVFFMDEVQELLKQVTVVNVEKVFRPRKEGKTIERSVYQFVTTDELKSLQDEYLQKAEVKLQMPPAMEERNPKGRVLERDPLITGFDNSKLVFTDITYGVPDRERLIVVRDLDGTLRTADWDEQDRINLTYYPRDDKKHYTPAMFEPENLETLLGPEKYEYILDRNCAQFEPDHPTYIRTAEIVYNHVNENNNFRALETTRHFGPMLFYLCWNKKIDDVLVHKILDKKMDSAVKILKLYQIITKDNCFDIVENEKQSVMNFARSSAAKRGQKVKMSLEKI